MKTEKIVLSFIAIIIGTLVAGVIFYLYQSTKTIGPKNSKTIVTVKPSPTDSPNSSNFLTVDTPKDESVTDKKTVIVSGKTIENAIIVITTALDDVVVTPATNGSFSTTTTIGDGENLLQVTAIAPTGEETTITKTITYSTENF